VLLEEEAIPKRLIDTLRDGTAPESIRRKGACGDLPVGLEEKIEILALLAADADRAISQQAQETLRHWDTRELEQLLLDSATSLEVIDFIITSLGEREDALEASASAPALSGESGPSAEAASPEQGASLEVASPPGPEAEVGQAPADAEAGRETLLQRIARMNPVAKIRLALMGGQEARLILLRDSNRAVVRAVLQSPKLSDSEVESFAAMRNVQEEVLRLIAKNRNFTKNPAVIRALVFNPRTPFDVSLPLVKYLKDRDLKLLTMDKNVPDTVRANAVRLYITRTQSHGPTLPGRH